MKSASLINQRLRSRRTLLAMCPNCAAVYQMDDDAKLQKELKAKKNILSTHEQSMELLKIFRWSGALRVS
jgi:hypothetical protein